MSKNNKSEINENLLLAIKNGNIARIEQLFKQGASPNYIRFDKSHISETFLSDKLSETKKIEMIKLFLMNKVQVDSIYLDSLNQIIESGYEDLAKILVVNVRHINPYLRSAAYKGYEKLVSLILNTGVKLTQNDKDLLSYYNINGQIKDLLLQAINTDKLFDEIVTKEQISISLSNQTKPHNHSSSSQEWYDNHVNDTHDTRIQPYITQLSNSDFGPRKFPMNDQKPISENSELPNEMGRNDEHETELPSQSLPHGTAPSILSFDNVSENSFGEIKDKSEILLERFNAILSKKVNNIFRCTIDHNEESSQKAEVDNLVNSLQNLLVKVVSNLKQASFFEKNEQSMSKAGELFNYNKILKLYFGNFDNFTSENSTPSSKFLVVIELLFYQYISMLKHNIQIDIASDLVNCSEDNPNGFASLCTQEYSSIDECTFEFVSTNYKYVPAKQCMPENSQSMIIGESALDPI